MLSRLRILFVRFFYGVDLVHKGLAACLKLAVVSLFFFLLARFFWNQAKTWRHAEPLPIHLNLAGTLSAEPTTKGGINSFQLARLIRTAAKDPSVSGLILELDQLTDAPLSALSYLGKALKEFRCSGKPVYAIGESYTQEQYYLATFANKIYLDPAGRVDFRGFGSHLVYFGRLAEKLKLKAHVFKTGKHKSAYDIYTKSEPLASEVEHLRSCFSDLWQQFVLTIVNNRNVDPSVVVASPQLLLKKLKASDGNGAAYAVRAHLVDEILPSREARKALKSMFRQTRHRELCTLPYQTYANKPYRSGRRSSCLVHRSSKLPKIGVFTLTGIIGNGNPAYQQERIEGLLQLAAEDDQIAALVVRINSPGGDAHLSEKVRSTLASFKQCRKPLVISFGSLGASGGYWIAMTGDRLVAESTSLIGSIGVLTMVEDYSELLTDLGIDTHSIGSVGAWGFPPFSVNPDTLDLAEFRMKVIYKQFVHLVAAARRLSIGAVARLADGSVWTGTIAEEKGLIDTVGDLEKAVEIAAELADCNRFELSWLEEEQDAAQATWSSRIKRAWRVHCARFRKAIIQQICEVLAETEAIAWKQLEFPFRNRNGFECILLAPLPFAYL